MRKEEQTIIRRNEKKSWFGTGFDNRSSVLIVDEPTTGLDPEERIRIRNLLVDFGRDRSVLFSSHVVEDLASTCNDLCILKKERKYMMVQYSI